MLSPTDKLLEAIFTSKPRRRGMAINVKIKVVGGTASGSTELCLSCSRAHVVRFSDNKSFVQCGAMGEPVHGKVVECNKYRNAAQPSLADMEEIAWRIVTERKGGAAGFVSASKFRKLVDEGRVDNDSLRHDDYD